MLKHTRTLKLSALSFGLLMSVAAQAADIGTGDGWLVDANASANVVGGSSALLNGVGQNGDDFDVYLDKPLATFRVTSPSGVVEFYGAFNLDVLARRHVNMNENGDKFSSFDNREARHIIEELSASAMVNEQLFVTAGIGTVAFLHPRGTVTSRMSAQDDNYELAERLFAEVMYKLDNGTTIQMSVFDGTKQKAVDVEGAFSASDFYDPVDFDGRIGDSISGAVRVDHELGSTGIHATLAYALVRNVDAKGTDEHMVSVGLDAAYELGDWMIYGVAQMAHVFGDNSRTSVLGEVALERDRVMVYVQGEYTEYERNGMQDTLRATLGAKYQLISNEHFTLSPFAELYAETGSETNDDTNIGLFIGANVELGGQVELLRDNKSE